jgi:tRNA uridine 5-carboxymethylaminomethyl modification enzyme
MPKGNKLGLVSDAQLATLREKEKGINYAIEYLERNFIAPNAANEILRNANLSTIEEHDSYTQLLKRPTITLGQLTAGLEDAELRRCFSLPGVKEQVEIDVKYDGYIKRELEQISKFSKFEEYEIPEGFDFSSIRSLSIEGKERLRKVMPRSIGQASRISGVTISDISVLSVFLKR